MQYKPFLAAVLVLLAAAFSNAFELTLSADSVSSNWCSPASLNAWVSGAPEGTTAYFSVESGYSTAVVETPQASVGGSGGAATRIVLYVPQCFIGASDVTVTAQVCGASCESKRVGVRVNAFPCPEVQCAYVISASSTSVVGTVSPSPNPQAMCGSVPCAEVISTIVREGDYAPTDYRASLERSVSLRCLSSYCSNDQVRAGESLAVQFKARNTGAAGSFEARASVDSSWISFSPKSVSFELSRGESTNLDFTVQAKPGTPSGVYSISVKIWHGGREIDSLTQWVEVIGEAGGEAKLVIPPEIVLESCNPPEKIIVPASIESSGASQEFEVSASIRGERVFAQRVITEQRISRQFDLLVDYSKLQMGQNLLEVSASSREFYGSGAMRLVLLPCQPTPLPTALPPERSAFDFAGQSGNKITIVATVANEGSDYLVGVNGELSGLPSAWNYSSALINVAPKSERNLTLIALATTPETVSPVLVIKSGDKIISVRQLGELNKQASLTGFLVTVTSENLVGVFLVMAALAAGLLYLAAKNKEEASEHGYKKKISRIRQELANMNGSPA